MKNDCESLYVYVIRVVSNKEHDDVDFELYERNRLFNYVNDIDRQPKRNK